MIFDSKDDDWLIISAPDMNGDGERGLIDHFMYEDHLAREEQRIEDKFRAFDEIAEVDPLSDTDEDDDLSSDDYGFDLEESDDSLNEEDDVFDFDTDIDDYDSEEDEEEEEEYDNDEEDEENGDGAYDPQIGAIVDFINFQDEETREKIAQRLYSWQAALEKSLDTSWHDEVEDGSKYGICPEDFESKEEYEEALENEKHWWVEYAEDGSEYGLDPYSFDSENDYEDALYKAKYGWHDEVEGIDEFNLDPFDYNTREEYEAALAKAKEEAKYEWREWVFDASEYGIDPNDYETETEYLDAYMKASSTGMNGAGPADKPAAAETNSSEEKKRPNINDENIYRYCMVEIELPFSQCLYYFPGDLELSVGDKVIVPYGKREVNGTVTEMGEQRGEDFPFDIAKIKKVIIKI